MVLSDLMRLEGFQKWDLLGISKIGDIWDTQGTLTFDELQRQFELADSQHYKYLQVRHALAKYASHMQDMVAETPLEFRLLAAPLHKHAISQINKMLLNNGQQPLARLEDKWE